MQKGLYGREDLLWDEKTHHGQNTPGFWQFVRGFWSPLGAEAAIYSGQEIMVYHADRHCGNGWSWMDVPVGVAGLDPAFVGGGDRAVAYEGKLGLAQGEDRQTKLVLEFIGYEVLAGDVTKGHDKPRQVAEAYREFCEKRGIAIRNVGVDVTGQTSFGSLLRGVWGDGFLEVVFSESASDAQISDTDSKPASEAYVNKRSEVWYSAKPLIRSGQIKGIDPDMASEICSCTFKVVGGGKTAVERKEDMKKRTGFSPDIAEAAWVMLQVARERLGLVSTERARKAGGSGQGAGWSDEDFVKWAEGLRGARVEDLQFEGTRT